MDELLQLLSLNVSKTETAFQYIGVKIEKAPSSSSFLFETWFDWRASYHFVANHWWAGYVAVVIYLVTIFGLQNYMKNRKAFDLKHELFWWNTVLGVFSIAGFSRSAPEFFQGLWQRGFQNHLCVM